MYAAIKGYTDIVELLIVYGAKVNATDINGMSALMFTSYNGHSKTVKLLVEHGADLGAVNNDGKDALELAKQGYKHDIDVVEYSGSLKQKLKSIF